MLWASEARLSGVFTPIGHLPLHWCKRAEQPKVPGCQEAWNLWLTGRWTLGPALTNTNGETTAPSSFVENPRLCLKCWFFEVYECKTRKQSPCYPPTLLSKSFPRRNLYSGRRWLGSVVCRCRGGRGAQTLHHAASSITLLITWRYSLITGERFPLKLLFCWEIYSALRHNMS